MNRLFYLLIALVFLSACEPSREDQLIAVEERFNELVKDATDGCAEVKSMHITNEERIDRSGIKLFGKRVSAKNGMEYTFEAEVEINATCYRKIGASGYFESPSTYSRAMTNKTGTTPLNPGHVFTITAELFYDYDFKEQEDYEKEFYDLSDVIQQVSFYREVSVEKIE